MKEGREEGKERGREEGKERGREEGEEGSTDQQISLRVWGLYSRL